MHFFDPKTSRLAEDFKACVLASMGDNKLTQQMLADAIGVDQATISRWFSYGGDLHFPACLTPMFSSDALRVLALDILRFQAQPLGFMVADSLGSVGEVNGSLDDELLEIGRLEGKMIELKDKSPRQVARLCDELERVVNRARLELKARK